MIIANGKFTRQTLAGKIAVVTGAGGGIGYEACRSLIWLGARTVVAEINRKNGRQAVRQLNEEFGPDSAFFVATDVGDEGSVRKLAKAAFRQYGKVDIVINNATLAALGAVKDVPIRDWDASYRVNLRGPVLLARAFLPGMLERKSGVFVCVSSVGTAFTGAYEAIKAAQVHLGNTLDAELEGSGVYAFTIGPGFVPTRTALSAVPRLAEMMGISLDELRTILKDQTISVEAAGAGFAAAVVLAEQIKGQETASLPVLLAADIDVPSGEGKSIQTIPPEKWAQILDLTCRVRTTLAEQTGDWKNRSIFEQQWLIRAFNKRAGMTVEQWLEALGRLEQAGRENNAAALADIHASLGRLAGYYSYLGEMGKGYIKDPVEREKNLAIVDGWVKEAQSLGNLLGQ